MQDNFARMDRDVCFVGHSHVPRSTSRTAALPRRAGPRAAVARARPGARAIVNVGSVGQPRDGDPRLSYALFDGDDRHVRPARVRHVGRGSGDPRGPALPVFWPNASRSGADP
jgi:diadenosine tetraphosphatase ApaH/serine/threonine PP2A family protein phosphatase